QLLAAGPDEDGLLRLALVLSKRLPAGARRLRRRQRGAPDAPTPRRPEKPLALDDATPGELIMAFGARIVVDATSMRLGDGPGVPLRELRAVRLSPRFRGGPAELESPLQAKRAALYVVGETELARLVLPFPSFDARWVLGWLRTAVRRHQAPFDA